VNEEPLCPRYGSSNIVGYKQFYECFDCGYRWSLKRSSFQEKLSLILALCLIAIAVTFSVYAFVYTNILGPISIHVSPESPQPGTFAELSLTSTPPSEVTSGSIVEIPISVTVNENFNGYLEVNVTATDFTPTSSDVVVWTYPRVCELSAATWWDMTPSSIPNGVKWRLQDRVFQCSAGETGSIKIRIQFNTPNPTDSGTYQITIGLVS